MNQLLIFNLLRSALLAVAALTEGAAQQGQNQMGEARGGVLYAQMCASCHGESGQGMDGAYDRPLVGDLSIGQLAAYIDRTMPEEEPESCVGEDAVAVAEYMHQAFYSDAAQVRLRPPEQMLSRLTAEQLRQSLSDLYASGSRPVRRQSEQGLKGRYYRTLQQRNEDLAVERVDPVVNFDFGTESPGAGIPNKNFMISWQGGLKVDRSGLYEIIVDSSCSFTMQLGHHQRTLIDNHVQSGDKTRFQVSLKLTGGRVYPLQINFIQRERKTALPPAKIALSWIQPGGAEEIIPPENLMPHSTAAQFSIQANLPAEDRSYGFERGIKVDRDWDWAVTQAAIEFGQIAAQELWPEYQRKNKDQPAVDRQMLKNFLREIVRVAFHYRLDDQQYSALIDRQVNSEADDFLAIKRVLLLVIKSPRFLYPTIDIDHSKSSQAATRLALCLLDSLPVEPKLFEAIEANDLESAEQCRQMATYLMDDLRAMAKTKAMLYEWLNITAPRDQMKKPDLFGGFDAQLVGDLKRSLDAQLDYVMGQPTSDFRQLLTLDKSYTTQRLQNYYGSLWQPAEPFPEAKPTSESDVSTAAYAALAWTQPQPGLAGVITHPYLLSRLAYHDSTSPIHRGVFILRYLLGRIIQPPQDAAFTALPPDLHPDLTTRERVLLQTSPQDCHDCHNRFNGLGFTLENWDAAGRFREMEASKPIDSSGDYTNRDGQQIQFAGVVELANYLVGSTDAHQAFVRRAFQHFVKQPPAAFGPETLDRLTKDFVEHQFDIRRLLVEIAVVAASTADSPPTTE